MTSLVLTVDLVSSSSRGGNLRLLGRRLSLKESLLAITLTFVLFSFSLRNFFPRFDSLRPLENFLSRFDSLRPLENFLSRFDSICSLENFLARFDSLRPLENFLSFRSVGLFSRCEDCLLRFGLPFSRFDVQSVPFFSDPTINCLRYDVQFSFRAEICEENFFYFLKR